MSRSHVYAPSPLLPNASMQKRGDVIAGLYGNNICITQNEADHCLLLALPCGKNADDVHIQTENLKNGLISYLLQKQAAGIISIQGSQVSACVHAI